MAKGCGHHSRIGDDDVEGLTLFQQGIGAGTHALKIGKIELNQLEASAVGRGVLSHLCGRRFSLVQIPRRAYNLRAVRPKRPRSLNSAPARNAGNKNPLSGQLEPGQKIFCSSRLAKYIPHSLPPLILTTVSTIPSISP